jgi:hypothetical protein
MITQKMVVVGLMSHAQHTSLFADFEEKSRKRKIINPNANRLQARRQIISFKFAGYAHI